MPNFNPRPRKEGDECYIALAEWKNGISIHALVKRATTHLHFDVQVDGISIHALVKRATKLPTALTNSAIYFNPRPRKEGDEQRTA